MVFTSRVAYAGVHAALGRKRRDGGLSPAVYRRAASAFDAEWPAYDQILVGEITLAEVRRLVQRHLLRGYDAIHLAAALWLRRQLGDQLEFWVSDERLEQAARQERMTVVNPEAT
jgi:predicted nucleic acid-binding protein